MEWDAAVVEWGGRARQVARPRGVTAARIASLELMANAPAAILKAAVAAMASAVRQPAGVSEHPGPSWAGATELHAACCRPRSSPRRPSPLPPLRAVLARQARCSEPLRASKQPPGHSREFPRARTSQPVLHEAVWALEAQAACSHRVPPQPGRVHDVRLPGELRRRRRSHSWTGEAHAIRLYSTGAVDRPCLRRSNWSG
jgi:hypothetical protein